MSSFDILASGTGRPVLFRTYSRRLPSGERESWDDICDRVISYLTRVGRLTEEEAANLNKYLRSLKAVVAGRVLWVGGTEWIDAPENVYGAYNCSSTIMDSLSNFGSLMNLAMMGVGTGAVLVEEAISKLPPIANKMEISVQGQFGDTPASDRQELTSLSIEGDRVFMKVGDSRQGWVESYQALLELACAPGYGGRVYVTVDLSDVRPEGEPLKRFGGVANPFKLPEMYGRIANIFNAAVGRQLNSVEWCLVIDEAMIPIVAGSIRRSAGMRQAGGEDELFAGAKLNLWEQDEAGNWRIDPRRDALRMANHTRVFHEKPTQDECVEAVRKQYYSGEGAIQWAREAVCRANADILRSAVERDNFRNAPQGDCRNILRQAYLATYKTPPTKDELDHRLSRFGLNPCGEIIGANFKCNLAEVFLPLIDPENLEEQDEAFATAAISVAALLHQKFPDSNYQYSRDIDPIVAVCPTGMFDFFVKTLGIKWLQWWEAGRPKDWVSQTLPSQVERICHILDIDIFLSDEGRDDEASHPCFNLGLLFNRIESRYLQRWRKAAEKTVREYCDRHALRCPNRCTAVQPSGTKSLLAGISPGWHPPKAQRYIRRITFHKNDPVALACIDYGYSVIPSQSDKDKDGNLLDDPFSELCTEWLVEIPVAVPWADLPGADRIAIERFSALAQFDFYAKVQSEYVGHNTSGTLEVREDEVELLGERIYRAIRDNEGYVSCAIIARFDDHQTMPRLPFEPIDKETYDRMMREVLARRVTDDFRSAIEQHDTGSMEPQGPSPCDSDKCLFPQ